MTYEYTGFLSKLLLSLKQQQIITYTLADPDDWNELECKFMGLCKLGPEPQYKQRRIDILTIPEPQWGAALIYFTGDDIFNRSMRLLAHHKGCEFYGDSLSLLSVTIYAC